MYRNLTLALLKQVIIESWSWKLKVHLSYPSSFIELLCLVTSYDGELPLYQGCPIFVQPWLCKNCSSVSLPFPPLGTLGSKIISVMIVVSINTLDWVLLGAS